MEMTTGEWDKIKALFEAALEQPAASRGSFLSNNCPNEAARAQVEKLLHDHEAAGSFLNESVLDWQALPADILSQAEWDAAGSQAAGGESSLDSLIGRRVGAYQIERLIGSGGMAAVYLASRADSAYEKQVAIKIVRSGSESEEILGRFRSERQTLAGLDHPNIVRLLDGGSTERRFPFLVMDYVEGKPIDAFCDGHTLPIDERLGLFCKVCAAVQHAHDRQVIHRDLKPGNILVTDDGTPKLLDFGIAKVLNPSVSPNTLLTQTNQRRMTPAYASPEQLRGEAITTASDVYSLGVVLYELLTGHRPYKLKRQAAVDIERAICDEEPESPSTAIARVETTTTSDGTSVTITPEMVSRSRGIEPDQLRSRLLGDLDNVVLMALRKEPQSRYGRAGDLADDIQRHLKHLPVVARSSTWGYRAAQFLRRRKTEAVAGALGFAVAGGALGFSLWEAHVASAKLRSAIHDQRSKGRNSVAVLDLKNESRKSETAWLANALPEMLTSELAAGEKLRAISREEVAQTKVSLGLSETALLGRKSLSQIYQNLGSDFVVLGSYRQADDAKHGVHVELRIEDAALGETVATLAEDGSEDTLPDLVARAGADIRDKLGIPRISAAESAKAQAAFSQNPEATKLYAEGIKRLQTFDTLGGRDLLEKAVTLDPNNPLIHSGLMEAWGVLGYDARAKDEAKKAFDLSANLPREQALWIEGRYRQVARQNERAAEIYRTLFNFFPDNLRYGLRLVSVQKGKEALATIASLRNLPPPAGDDPWIDIAEIDTTGGMGDLRRQADAAARATRKAEAMGSRLLAGRTRTTLGSVLDQLGERDKALEELTISKKILTEVGDRFGVARALRFMGSLFSGEGKFAEAKLVEEEALQIVREIGNRRVEAQLLNNLAGVLAHQGDIAGSIARLKESEAISRELGNRAALANTLGNLGTTELDQRQIQAAKVHFQEALDIDRQAGDQVGVGNILSQFAVALEAEGNTSAAKSMLGESIEVHRHTGRKTQLGIALTNLGGLQAAQGDLAAAKKSYQEAEQVFTDSNSQIFLGDAMAGLGGIALDQDDFVEAHKRQAEALAQRQKVGDKMYLALSWEALADLALEEGHPADASRLATDAAAVFHDERSVDLELGARALMASALQAQGKLGDARTVIADVRERCAHLEDVSTQIDVAIAYAEIMAASGKTADAENLLLKTAAEARKAGLLRLYLAARLATGETQIHAGKRKAGEAHLALLERDAKAKGLLFIARKAAEARKGARPNTNE